MLGAGLDTFAQRRPDLRERLTVFEVDQPGTPFLSFYSPEEMVARAGAAGFADARHVSSRVLADRYFAGRPDGLRSSTGEDLVVATT